jgi:hypothetical protein
MLLNEVNGISELQQVKNTADQMVTTSGTMLAYDEYTTLLLSVESAYDDQFKATKSIRHVMLYEIQHKKPVLMMIMRCLTLIVPLVQFKHMPPTFVPIQIDITCGCFRHDTLNVSRRNGLTLRLSSIDETCV